MNASTPSDRDPPPPIDTDAVTPQPPAEPDDNALESIGRAITQPLRDAAGPDEARQTPAERPGR